jgi:hypothetical protein
MVGPGSSLGSLNCSHLLQEAMSCGEAAAVREGAEWWCSGGRDKMDVVWGVFWLDEVGCGVLV